MTNDYSRAVHVDFHTMPGIYDINNFDAEDFAQTLFDSNVTYVNVVAECNLGFCYYPTKIGIVYPNLTRDLLGETITACHKRGIKVTAYVNGGINHANTIKRPEWCKVNADGKIVTDGADNYTVRSTCFNTGYYDFLKSLINEISQYDIDGIFCDCMIHTPCYCSKCVSDMTKQGIDYHDKKAALKFAEQVKDRFCNEIRGMLKSNIHTFFNAMLWNKPYEDHIELECLPTDDCWTFDYFAPYAAHARSCGKEVTYMTGRFQLSWGDFGGIRTKASLENDMYDALCNGFGFSIGDHRHPARGLIKPLYKTIGELFSELKTYEKWTQNTKYIAEIGILVGTISYDMWEHMGICRMLSELKHDYNIIYDSANFNDFKIIFLPNNTTISSETAKKLEEFISNGGKIISCGSGGLNENKTDFALSQYRNMLEFCGEDKHTHGYFEITNNKNSEFSNMQWSMYLPSVLIKANCGEVWANYVTTYFDKHFDGLFNYLYIPPEKELEYSSVVVGDNIAHICFDIFNAYGENFLTAHREIIKQILEKFLPCPQIKTQNLPISSRVTLTGNSAHKNLHIKVTYPECKLRKGVIDNHITQKAGGVVYVKGRYLSATTALSDTPLNVTQDGDYTKIILPEITGYLMIVLQ